MRGFGRPRMRSSPARSPRRGRERGPALQTPLDKERTMSNDKCGLCHGTGSLWSQPDASLASLQVKVTCPSCGGSGRK